jgi:hypothetical protein
VAMHACVVPLSCARCSSCSPYSSRQGPLAAAGLLLVVSIVPLLFLHCCARTGSLLTLVVTSP